MSKHGNRDKDTLLEIPGAETMMEHLEAWPAVERLVFRLTALRAAWAPLRDFSRSCLRGDPRATTLFLAYERDALGATFGEHGIRLILRFDRGDARRCFRGLSVGNFGDEQISEMSVEGPPTIPFRAMEEAVWAVVYQEVRRSERAGPHESGPEFPRAGR